VLALAACFPVPEAQKSELAMESGTDVVGREDEVTALVDFVDARAPAGCPVLEGEVGVGKTTLWRHGVELAAERGYRVLSCSGSSSETQSAFRRSRLRSSPKACTLAPPGAFFTLQRLGAGMPLPSPEQQQRARIFGVLFALTFVTSIAALLLYDPVLNDADYVLGDGADTRVQLGALCEIFLAITNIGTAVVLWPIVRRQSETLALSYVASRVVESIIIVVGLISLLSVVTLREDFVGAGAEAASLSIAGESLVAIHDWTFLLGPGFCVGVNGLLLGYLFYRSGLVPRWIAMFGLVGGPLIFASAIAVLFGAYEQEGAHFLFSIPEIVFEASITIYTIVKGFRPSPILDDARYGQVGAGSVSPAVAAP
jgi:Domain of unknown function (DUF4386)